VSREGVKVGRNEKGRCESEGGLVGGVVYSLVFSFLPLQMFCFWLFDIYKPPEKKLLNDHATVP